MDTIPVSFVFFFSHSQPAHLHNPFTDLCTQRVRTLPIRTHNPPACFLRVYHPASDVSIFIGGSITDFFSCLCRYHTCKVRSVSFYFFYLHSQRNNHQDDQCRDDQPAYHHHHLPGCHHHHPSVCHHHHLSVYVSHRHAHASACSAPTQHEDTPRECARTYTHVHPTQIRPRRNTPTHVHIGHWWMYVQKHLRGTVVLYSSILSI